MIPQRHVFHHFKVGVCIYFCLLCSAFSLKFPFSSARERFKLHKRNRAMNIVSYQLMGMGPSIEENRSLRDIHVHSNNIALYKAIMECEDAYISEKLKNAVSILNDALRLYGPDQLFTSYNGGKDAVVILHILRAVFADYNERTGNSCRPNLVYFELNDEFPEVLDHLKSTQEELNLEITSYKSGIREGLIEHINFLQEQGYRTPAFVIGTRHSDPNSAGQEKFCPSSSWMPPFMRINPILDWDYGHIWHFLRTFQLSYCHLYDKGYTSLGKVKDTLPNPSLRIDRCGNKIDHILLEDKNRRIYFPAYMLSDWSSERKGRNVKSMEDSDNTKAKIHVLDRIENVFLRTGLIIVDDYEIEDLQQTNQNIIINTIRNELTKVHAKVEKISILPNHIKSLMDELMYMRNEYDIVLIITSSTDIHQILNDSMERRVQDDSRKNVNLNPSALEYTIPRGNDTTTSSVTRYENIFLISKNEDDIFADSLALIVDSYLKPNFSGDMVVSKQLILKHGQLQETMKRINTILDLPSTKVRWLPSSSSSSSSSEEEMRISIESDTIMKLEKALDTLVEQLPDEIIVRMCN
jgi:FAD synthetase